MNLSEEKIVEEAKSKFPDVPTGALCDRHYLALVSKMIDGTPLTRDNRGRNFRDHGYDAVPVVDEEYCVVCHSPATNRLVKR